MSVILELAQLTAFSSAQEKVYQLFIIIHMRERLVMPCLVLPECSLESTLFRFAAHLEAVFECRGFFIPMIFQRFTFASGYSHLISLDCQLN